MTSITPGIVIVFTLEGSSTVGTTQRTLSPSVDIALGGLLLALAYVIRSGRVARARERRRERKLEKRDTGPPRWQRALSKGSARTTFVVGALLTLPGASYLAGLTQIHKLDYSTPVTILLIIGFNIVMLALLEIPLLCFVVAPDWTPNAIERAKAWIGQRAEKFAERGFAVIGALLIIKGIVGLIVA
jgi:Sap, sulfolipid-1-addressing protein